LKKRSGKTASASPRSSARLRRSPKSDVPDAVFLVGFMGAGKTSVGRALGQRMNWLFEDLDDRIERLEGRSVAEIFRDSGEPAFRQAEHSALKQLLAEIRGSGRVVALGGGAFVQKNNAALLQTSGLPTVFLDAPVDELWQRCCDQALAAGAERPLLQSAEIFRKLYETRRASYTQALITIQTGGRTVEQIAAEIIHALGLKKNALKKLL
jgi:shikimate kinase